MVLARDGALSSSCLSVVTWDKVLLESLTDELGHVVRIGLTEQLLTMVLDGVDGNEHFFRYLATAHAFGQELEDLKFALSQFQMRGSHKAKN